MSIPTASITVLTQAQIAELPPGACQHLCCALFRLYGHSPWANTAIHQGLSRNKHAVGTAVTGWWLCGGTRRDTSILWVSELIANDEVGARS